MSPTDVAPNPNDRPVTASVAEQTGVPAPSFEHLRSLTDQIGLWEHAEWSLPREEHGFCTDDNARALVVVSRQTLLSGGVADLAEIYLNFVLDARTASGQFHNRRDSQGSWIDTVGSDDSLGRAWWGLGAVARSGPDEWMRSAGAEAFDACGSFDSPHLRSNAYAALGAVEMLLADADHAPAAALLDRTSAVIAESARRRSPWPEARLTYDNARLPEALIAAGTATSDDGLTELGLRLLGWLLTIETDGDHFSFTPSTGWAPGEPRPAFDQQPIEAAGMAEACHRAWSVTGDEAWRMRAVTAAMWFLGMNDTGMTLYDRATGGTGDGLMEGSVNENRGTESTLAGLAAMQIAALCTAAG